MPNYGPVTGGSGIGDLLSGFLSGYGTGEQFRSQREAERLQREREARYAEQDRLEAEARALSAERQAALDATNGLFKADQVDPSEQVTTRTYTPELRQGLGAAGDVLGGLDPMQGQMLDSLAAGLRNETTNKYQVAGNYAIDRTQHDPMLKQAMADDRTQVDEGRARAGLLQLTGTDGGRLFRPEEVHGRTGSSLKALQDLGVTLPVEQRLDEAKFARNEAADIAGEERQFGRSIKLADHQSALRRQEDTHAASLKPKTPAAGMGFNPLRAAALRKEFQTVTKDIATQASAYRKIATIGAAENPQGADDVALIFSYMKLLDPTSVVRESEYATAANTGLSVPDQVRRQYNKALEGKYLSPDQRRDMVQAAERVGNAARQQLAERSAQFGSLASLEGIPAEYVTYDHFGADTGAASREAKMAKYMGRVRELEAGGMKTDQARAKARAEMSGSN